MSDSRITLLERQRQLLKDWDADLSRRDLYTHSALIDIDNELPMEFAHEAAPERKYLLAKLVRIGVEQAQIELFDRHATLAAHFEVNSRLFRSNDKT
jgi:hypothetical protein